jgi:hypothetical protein
LWLRSWAALSGELIGFGSVWLVVIGSGYVRCRDSGACIGHENMVPFIAIASVVLVFGALVGLVGVARWRDRRSAF